MILQPRDMLAAAYEDLIGYDPVKDEPRCTTEEILGTIQEYLECVNAETAELV